jgi:hypothetical protein
VNLIQFILLTAGLVLSLAWVLRYRAPEAVAIRVRDVVLELEGMLRNRKDVDR